MSAPVKFTCPNINQVISDITEVYDGLDFTEESTIEDLQAVISESSSKIYTFTDKIQACYNPLEDLRDDNCKLRDWGTVLEEQIDELEKERDKLIDQASTDEYNFNDHIGNLEDKVDELKNEIEVLSTEKVALEDKVVDLQTEINRLHLLFETQNIIS